MKVLKTSGKDNRKGILQSNPKQRICKNLQWNRYLKKWAALMRKSAITIYQTSHSHKEKQKPDGLWGTALRKALKEAK